MKFSYPHAQSRDTVFLVQPHAASRDTRALGVVDPAASAGSGPRSNVMRCIGRAHAQLGHVAEARAALARAVTLTEGAPNARQAYALADLGELEVSAGDLAAGQAACERSLAVFTAGVDPADHTEHPDDALAYACRGRARLERGDHAAAREDLEHALRLGSTSSPLGRGELRFALARTYTALRVEGERARELARAAIVDFTEAQKSARADTVRAFLAAHEP